MKPKISVVTVSFNSEKTIAETIESVLGQTYENYDYIIVFEDKKVSYKIVSEKDNGIYDAMNKGIALTDGDIVGIINSDDYYNSDALEKVAKFYSETKFDVMYGDLRIFGDGKEYIKKASLDKKFTTRHWNHPTTFVTRKVYDNVRFACESIYDDLDFMLTVREKNYTIKVLNEVLANFRLGGVSNNKCWKKCRERIRLRNAIYKEHGCKGYRFDNFATEVGKFLLS